MEDESEDEDEEEDDYSDDEDYDEYEELVRALAGRVALASCDCNRSTS